MKKKIFIATGVYPPESGGPATYTRLLEERLPALGFEVSVLPYRAVRGLPKGLSHLAYLLMSIGYAASADVVYAQDTVSVGWPASIAARICGKPFLVRVPGDYAWEQGRARFGVKESLDDFQRGTYAPEVERLRRIQCRVVRRAKVVVAPSQYLGRIVEGFGVPKEKVRVIYNGIDLDVSSEPPKERPSGYLVVSSGRRVPWKGFEALEHTVSGEKDWHLFIAENLPRAQALGWVKAADVYALNSTYEGLSHALLEAMALGTPIVATRVGGNPELIRDGVDGLLIPPNDEAALHAALKKVQQDKEGAYARAQSALERVKEFSIDASIAQVCKLF